MSTSDRPSAGGSDPRQPPVADDAAPAALSLPHDERLALARKLLAEGTAASAAGTVPAAEAASATERTSYPRSSAQRVAAERVASRAASSGEPPSGGDGDAASDESTSAAPRRASRRARGNAWDDSDDFLDSGEMERRPRRTGSIRRTISTVDPWDDQPTAPSAESAARGSRRSANAGPIDPWDELPSTASGKSGGRTSSRRTNADPIDPWGDDDAEAAAARDAQAEARLAEARAFAADTPVSPRDRSPRNTPDWPDTRRDLAPPECSETMRAGRTQPVTQPRSTAAPRDTSASFDPWADLSDESGEQPDEQPAADGLTAEAGAESARAAVASQRRRTGSNRSGDSNQLRAGAAAAGRAEPRRAADGEEEDAAAARETAGRGGSSAERRAAARRRSGGGFGRRKKRPAGDEPSGTGDPEQDGPPADPHSVARTILLDKLTGQPRTRAELADVLAERDIPDEVADEVLDRFTEVGLINDAAFAEAWVESRHRGRRLGKRALAQELRRRGVDDQLARDALEELDSDQEEATARELVRRKLRSMRSLDRQVAMRRLLGMLARKGYPGGLAMSVVKQELDAGHDEFPLIDDSGLGPE